MTSTRTLSMILPAKSCGSWWLWALRVLPFIPCYSHIRSELWFLSWLRC